MANKTELSYYEFEVGRYLPDPFDATKRSFEPYKEDKSNLVWNVIIINNGDCEVRNIFEYNWPFLENGLLVAKKKHSKDYKKFADHIRNWLQYEYWSRVQYEMVISGWPSKALYKKDMDDLNRALQAEIARCKQNGWDETRAYVHAPMDNAKRIDVYQQIMINWDRFIQYVWDNKRLITKKKLGL